MANKYIVDLTAAEQEYLGCLTHGHPAVPTPSLEANCACSACSSLACSSLSSAS